MEEILSLVSLSEIVNGLIVVAIVALAGYVVHYAYGSLKRVWLRTQQLASSKRATWRERGYIEIWKRIKSDEYFASRQKVEIVGLGLSLSLMILLVLLFVMGQVDDQLSLEVLPAIPALAIAMTAHNVEQKLNDKALYFRIRLERRRRVKRLEQRREDSDVR